MKYVLNVIFSKNINTKLTYLVFGVVFASDTHVVSESKSKGEGFYPPLPLSLTFYRKRPVVCVPTGLSVKDWTKLWRFVKVCFPDFMNFSIAFKATT